MIDEFASEEAQNEPVPVEKEGDGWRGDCETEDCIEYLEVTREG